jgi:hypothetical protein
MFDTTDIRRTCQNILDGMSFNREKLARAGIEMCTHVETQARALKLEQDKNKTLNAEVEALKAQLAQAKDASNTGFAGGLGGAFGDVFGDIFKPTDQYKTPK